jgi:hypothetical protein
MAQVYSTSSNNIRTTINASGLLEAIFNVRERNKIIKQSMLSAGQQLVVKFWAKRFTSYVVRAPFSYPKKPVKLGVKKLRGQSLGNESSSIGLGQLWTRIKQREFFGWDPWSSYPIPDELFKKWITENSGQYGRTKDEYARARSDLRRWAKKRTHEYAANLIEDEVILPLVDSGLLRKLATQNTSVKAVSTQKRSRCTIATPRGGRQNKLAVRILGTLPSWEFDAFVRDMNVALKENIKLAEQNQKPKVTRPRTAKIEPRKVG